MLALLLAVFLFQVVSVYASAVEDDTVSVDNGVGAQGGENMDPETNLPYLFAVFAVTWAVLFAYVLMMSQKYRRLRAEVKALKASMEERAAQREVG